MPNRTMIKAARAWGRRRLTHMCFRVVCVRSGLWHDQCVPMRERGTWHDPAWGGGTGCPAGGMISALIKTVVRFLSSIMASTCSGCSNHSAAQTLHADPNDHFTRTAGSSDCGLQLTICESRDLQLTDCELELTFCELQISQLDHCFVRRKFRNPQIVRCNAIFCIHEHI